MFTSRAEHRLLLRIDNADLRLTPRGREAGLVDDERWERFAGAKGSVRAQSASARVERSFERRRAIGLPASQLLRQPEFGLTDLIATGGFRASRSTRRRARSISRASRPTVKYAGYLRRQESEIERARQDERRRIPQDFPFDRVPGLSREVVQRLSQVRPTRSARRCGFPG